MVNSPGGITTTEALYQARGKPPLDKPVVFETFRLCGNCLSRKDVGKAHKILTSQFGSWDDVTQDPEGGRWLCLACASTYRAQDLRRRTSVIHQDGTLERPDLGGLRDVLSRPIPADVSVIIPLSGKKIIAPRAKWGQVVTDTCGLTWSARHKRLMGYGVALREMGFSEAALREESPPFVVLVDLPVEQHADVRHMWREFAVIRTDKTLLPLFLFLSRKVQ